jgi:hypothetical protein
MKASPITVQSMAKPKMQKLMIEWLGLSGGAMADGEVGGEAGAASDTLGRTLLSSPPTRSVNSSLPPALPPWQISGSASLK